MKQKLIFIMVITSIVLSGCSATKDLILDDKSYISPPKWIQADWGIYLYSNMWFRFTPDNIYFSTNGTVFDFKKEIKSPEFSQLGLENNDTYVIEFYIKNQNGLYERISYKFKLIDDNLEATMSRGGITVEPVLLIKKVISMPRRLYD